MLNNISEGLAASFVTALVSILLFWLGRRSSRDVWLKWAEQLRSELKRVYEKQITYLTGQCAAKDIEIERKDAQLEKQAIEIARLNRMVGSGGPHRPQPRQESS